jgi:hypothetical protein
VLSRLRKKNLHTWMRGYARHLARRARTRTQALSGGGDGPRHLLFAMCDHYEPLWAGAPEAEGRARVAAWRDGYPVMASGFRDADGRPPRHSWFFPGEEYRPEYLDDLAGLAKAGLGEVEVHMHHDGDTAETLRAKLERYLDIFAEHGHMSRATGANGAGGAKYQWAFIHGNWCLANGRPDGRWCGVNEELPLLWDLGCYADFTFPSAPDPCQSDMVDLIYWPTGDLRRRRSYDSGEMARVGTAFDDRLLIVTGPLSLVRKGGLGVRIENGALTGDDPPTPGRVDTWVDQGIHVAGRPDWVFVKVHTHGAVEKTADSLLGGDGRAMHEHLGRAYNDGARWKLHYVTAREMYNVARAAMDGKGGDPGLWRDYVVPPPPIAAG